MSEKPLQFNFDISHCYLEVARGSMMTIQHHLSLDEFLHKYGHETLINAALSIVSITVIYSYLTIESFINYQLFRIWERRHDDSPESMAFLNLLGDPQGFGALKTEKRTRELGDRLKTLCSILGYNKIHEKRPELWKDFKELIELSRHFFIHPYPGKYFQDNLLRIGTQTKGGKYVEVAVDILKYLFEQGGKPVPQWVNNNTMIAFKGIDLLVD